MTTPKTIKKAASSQGSDAGTLSRRNFIALLRPELPWESDNAQWLPLKF